MEFLQGFNLSAEDLSKEENLVGINLAGQMSFLKINHISDYQLSVYRFKSNSY